MAQNTRVELPADTWTQLTDADTSGDVSIMLASEVPVSLQATTDTTTPTDAAGPLELLTYGDGWSEATIAEKFPGVSGAVRLWAKPKSSNRDSLIGISHG